MTFFNSLWFRLNILLICFNLQAQEVRLNFMPSNGERGENRSFDLNEFIEHGREDGFISKSEYEKIKKQIDNYYKKNNKIVKKSSKSGRAIASLEDKNSLNQPRIIESVSDIEIKEYHEFVSDIDKVLKAVE
ncbi:MAG: hypothetical protein U0T83_03220 [Bacteriovoracaceae bacterium]